MLDRPQLKSTDEVFERVCTQSEVRRVARATPWMNEAVQEALATGTARAISDKLIGVPLEGGGELITLREKESILPSVTKATIEHLAKVCGIYSSSKGTYIPGRGLLIGKLRDHAQSIATLAKGDCRSKVTEEFEYISENSTAELYRDEAKMVLAWLEETSNG